MWKMPTIGVISMTYARPFMDADAAAFSRMKAAGLDFVELLLPEGDEIDPVRGAAAAREAGLGVALSARVNLQRDIASADAACRCEGVAYLKHCVDVAVTMGAKILGGPVYGSPLVFAGRAPHPIDEAARAARVDWVVAGLREVGAYAADHGIQIAVEPLNRYETDFCNTSRQVVDLCERVGLKSVGALLDTFHMSMEEDDLPAAIRHAARHLVHFQACENHRGFLGTGHVDWAPICRTLAEINYQGPITVEPFRRTDHRLSVPLAQWRPPQYDEDADLASAVAVLRGLLHAAGAR